MSSKKNYHRKYVHRGLFGYPDQPRVWRQQWKERNERERKLFEGTQRHFRQLLKEGRLDQHLRFLADALPQIVCTAESNGYQDYFNRRWFEYTGFSEEDTYAGKTALHPEDFPLSVERWSKAIKTGDIYEAEFRLRRGSDGMFRWHLARALPIKDEEGKVVKWFSTHTDIHDIKAAVQDMERLGSFPRLNPNPITELDASGRLYYINPTARRLFPDLSGRGRRHPWLADIQPFIDSLPKRRAKMRAREVKVGEHCYQQALQLLPSIGHVRIYGADITARTKKEEELRQLNRTQRALRNSSHALMRAVDERAYLRKICRIIVKDCGHAMVWIGYAEQDAAKTVRPVAYAGFTKGYIDALRVTWADTKRGRGPTGVAIRTGKACGCADMQTDPRFAPWRADALRRGYRSSIVLPLKRNGKAFGAVSIYAKEPRAFSKDEVRLLSELADDLAYGIESLRLRLAHARAEALLRMSEQMLKTMNERLEEKVAERTKELEILRAKDRANIRRLEDIINNVQVGIIAADEHLRILYVNDLYCQMFRLPGPRKIVGTSGRKIRAKVKEMFQSPEDVKAYDELSEHSMPVFGFEIPLKDGRILSRDYIPIFDEGVFRGQVVVYRDITREKRIDAAKSDFMSFASHQLRTPLTAVRWALGRLRRDLPPGSRERSLMEAAWRATKSMVETINTMLSISRIEAGTVSLFSSPVRIRALLLEAVASLREEFVGRGQTVVIRCVASLTLHTDPKLLKEVLCNLLSNAGKYSPDGARIHLTARRERKDVRVEVRDEGYGIPAEEQGKIFQKFYRAENAVQAVAEGSGLGLYLVSLLMRTLHGRIRFVSHPGKGTTFTLFLPSFRVMK